MKLTIDLTEQQRNCLKKFAQAQEKSSNFGEDKPIFAVESLVDIEYVPWDETIQKYSPCAEADGKRIAVFTDINSGREFYTAKEYIEFWYKSRNEESPANTIDWWDLPIDRSLESPNGEKVNIYNFNDYFKFYGVDKPDVGYRYCSYRPRAFFFTYEQAVAFTAYQSHNLTQPRIMAYGPGYQNAGDYIPIWDLLLEMGRKLLKEETEAKLVNLIRVRPIEDEAWTDTFKYSGEENPEEALRDAVKEYLNTEDGKKTIANTNYDFNWGDAIMFVPDRIWAKHGLTLARDSTVDVRVYQDEVLCGDKQTE